MIPPLLPITTEKIDGKYLCGVLGGDPFNKVKRPAKGTGECPAGTTACPGKASSTPENTVCYPLAEHGAKCPITDIWFGPIGKNPPSGYSMSKGIVAGKSVAFSKTMADNLPIMSTALS